MAISDKIVFVSSFAGSSAYLNTMIELIGFDNFCIASKNIGSKVFIDKGQIVDYDFNINDYNIKELLLIEKPKFVLMVSQFRNSIEKEFIKLSRNLGIIVISIIEHYSFYKERFSLMDNQNVEVVAKNIFLPDYIIVNDSIAKEEAIKAEIPEDLIVVLGNLNLENHNNRRKKIIDKTIWRETLGITSNFNRVISFISEDFKKDFPIESHLYEGFNEYEVLDDIIELKEEEDVIVVKLHPDENKTKYVDYIKSDDIIIIQNTDLDSLIYNCDFFIGMGSMLLIEASLFRNDVISYRPNDIKSFIGNKLGCTKKILSKKELKSVLNGKNISNKNIGQEHKGASVNFENFIKSVIV